MSDSSLWGIKKDYTGEELKDYENSWLFTPIIMDILGEKYIADILYTPYHTKRNVLFEESLWHELNNRLNSSDNMADRVVFELGNQCIFFTKDKDFIADCINNFVKQNKSYGISGEDNISSLERDHIVARFKDIANDIKSLNEEYPFFVIKGTSCDDSVESWFKKFDEETWSDKDISLKDSKEILTYFVIIDNNQTIEYITNTKFNY